MSKVVCFRITDRDEEIVQSLERLSPVRGRRADALREAVARGLASLAAEAGIPRGPSGPSVPSPRPSARARQ